MSTSRFRWLRLAARAPQLASRLARWGRPRRALVFGPLSLGDDLLCSAVLREARRRGVPFAMFTARPELFSGNTDPSHLLPIDDYYLAAIRRLGAEVVQPYYLTPDLQAPDRDLFPPRHIIAEMCRLAGLHGTVELRPYFFLDAEERRRGRLYSNQVALHSSGLAAAIPYANKEWGEKRFAEVARLLAPDFKLVQIGSVTDPALPVDADLRGKTTVRETAAILAASRVFVGLEGFLSHLARAVDCPAAVVFGGRARPEIFGYAANRNFYSGMPCAPCGLRSTCAYALECMARITPTAVATAARELAARSPGPLSVDTADLP